MIKITNEELAEATIAVRNAASAEELTRHTARLLELLDRASQSNLEADVRLHALNLACALHRESVRSAPGVPDVATIVLDTADRFNDWLAGPASTEFIGAAE